VSKQRARRRAERQQAETARLAENAEARHRRTAARRKQESRSRLWRSIRFWRSGHTPTRVKEQRAVIASTVFALIVITYAATRSVNMTIGVGLVAAIATPAVVAVMFERSKK